MDPCFPTRTLAALGLLPPPDMGTEDAPATPDASLIAAGLEPEPAQPREPSPDLQPRTLP